MTPDLMRKIDKWIGIPVCLLISLGHKFISLFVKEADAPTVPKKMLFMELSEMGSAIIAYPAMRYAQTRYPDADIFFLIFEQNRISVDILAIIPHDHVLTISVRSPFRFLVSTLTAVRWVNRLGIDTIIDLERFARFTALLSGVARAKTRVGFGRHQDEGLYRGDLISHPVIYNPHQHMAKNFLALVKSVEQTKASPFFKGNISEPLTVPRHQSTEDHLERLRQRLAAMSPVVQEADHMILFNLSNGEPLPNRAWPVSHYAALAKRILEHFNAAIICVGQEDAVENTKKIMNHIGCAETHFCIDFTRQTSLRELLDLFNLADVLVTADSGMAHFAALTDIRCVVLFGPETPVLYAPLGQNSVCLHAGFSCSPCFSVHNHCQTLCRDAECMKAVTVDEVFDVVARYLKLETWNLGRKKHEGFQHYDTETETPHPLR